MIEKKNAWKVFLEVWAVLLSYIWWWCHSSCLSASFPVQRLSFNTTFDVWGKPVITYLWDVPLMRKLFVFALNLVFAEDQSSKYGRRGDFFYWPCRPRNPPPDDSWWFFYEVKIKAQNHLKHNAKSLIIWINKAHWQPSHIYIYI